MTAKIARWPEDFATLDMPWGKETINTTWPLIAVTVPDGKPGTPDYYPAFMYHTNTKDNRPDVHFWLVKQSDGSYVVEHPAV